MLYPIQQVFDSLRHNFVACFLRHPESIYLSSSILDVLHVSSLIECHSLFRGSGLSEFVDMRLYHHDDRVARTLRGAALHFFCP